MVFPQPFEPRRKIRSQRLMLRFTFLKTGSLPKDFERFSAKSTSFPLLLFGLNEKCIVFCSVGAASKFFSSLSIIFCLLSAVFMFFSLFQRFCCSITALRRAIYAVVFSYTRDR